MRKENESDRTPPATERKRLRAVEQALPYNRYEDIGTIRRKIWGSGLTEDEEKVLDHRTLRFIRMLEAEGRAERRMEKGMPQFRHTERGHIG